MQWSSIENCTSKNTRKGITPFRNARGIVESETERNRKIRIPKGIRPSKMLDVLHKVKAYRKWNLKLQFRYQRRMYTPSFVFYQQPLRLLKTHLWPSSESHVKKIRKSVYNIKRYFKQFFTSLERTFTFIISLFRAIYRSSYADVFTKKRRSVTGT